MALRKCKLGELIELCTETNYDLKYSLKDVKGISIKKDFIETKADMKGVSLKPYLLVRPDCFAYVTVTSRNGEKVTIAHNTTSYTYLVSSSYVVFRVKNENILNSDWLFMFFNRSEFDRYARFDSWGSAREVFSFESLCDIEIELPDIDIQKKYVAVYLSMLSNQKSYEKGLDDLKLVYDGLLDELKHKNELVEIREYITQVDIRNESNYKYRFAGLSMDNYFIDSIADSNELDFRKYKIVAPNEYGAVLMKVGRDCRLTIARNTSKDYYLISPAYYVFKTHNIIPEYFMANVNRSEFERRAWFSCDSSARASLPWDDFLSLKIPLASEKKQQIIKELYNSQIIRFDINERLKQQIKDICPILIKGSIEEAKEA